MPDLKQAYTILGLDETATDEQVEQRYTMLLLKNRSKTGAGEGQTGDSAPSMEDITKAYNRIKGAAIEEQVRLKEPKNKTLGKIGHIWEYYRWHILGSIAAVIVIFYTATSIIDSKSMERKIANADLQVTFFTDFLVDDAAPFEEKLTQQMPDWNYVHIVTQYAPTEPKDEYAMAMLQKAVVSMAADKPDMYIMDKNNYMKFAKQGAFTNLDESPSLASIPESKRLKAENENGQAVWSGVDVTDSAAIKSLIAPKDAQKIAVIRVNGKKKDNAAKAIEWLAKE